jgi:anhydro-N-acetylmuramic acid kinase
LLKRLESYHAMQGHAVASPRDVQATLQALTARTVAQALRTWAEQTREVLVCGGGALNKSLMRELRSTLHCPVEPTSSAGVPVMAVEAMAFAWLAWAHENGHHAGLPAVTGARAARILGCRYPA